MEAAIRLLGDGPGDLLDVGTGSGRLLVGAATRGWTVSGVDPAPRMLELAAARLPSSAERLTLGTAEDLPYEDESFDAVTGIGVLEWAETIPALREMRRVLRPGGRAVLCLRNRQAPAAAWRHAVTFPVARRVKRVAPFGRALPSSRRKPFTLRQSRYAVGAAGLVVERVENVGCAVLLDPLDGLAPDLALRAARRAERSPTLRRALGTQRLLVAVRP